MSGTNQEIEGNNGVDTAGLTTNTIPKATASDTIGDSQITDDGTTVDIGGAPAASLRLKILAFDNTDFNGYRIYSNNAAQYSNVGWGGINSSYHLKLQSGSSQDIEFTPSSGYTKFIGNININGLTASQTVETDASKNLVSVAKATGYNLALGTAAGTVLEGDKILDLRQIYKSLRITQDSSTITGTTSETILSSVLIPANTFSVNDVINLEIRCKKASATGVTSHRIRLNTSNSLSGATLAGIVSNNNTVLMPTFSRNLVIKSSTNTEVMGTSATFSTDIGSITSAISSINIDWTIDQYIIISVQPSVSAETNILSYLLIERR